MICDIEKELARRACWARDKWPRGRERRRQSRLKGKGLSEKWPISDRSGSKQKGEFSQTLPLNVAHSNDRFRSLLRLFVPPEAIGFRAPPELDRRTERQFG